MSTTAELETFAAPDTAFEHRYDQTVILRSRHHLPRYESSIPAVLRARAEAHPDRTLAAQRDSQGNWGSLSYGETRARADALAQAFIDLGLNAERPVMILSGNSIEHLLVSLGAYTAGVPVMPVSVAYSL
ncbi:MAG: AMP-binding protein, partial [Solirubrobacterales bacterium]|nr:AMP-binding protein [Solirubrobacterales bacterium]